MVKEIQLTQGKVALVDDENYEILNKWKWYYSGGYAAHSQIKKINGKWIKRIIFLHRYVMSESPKAWIDRISGDLSRSHQQIDHINGDKLDNRRSNLRCCEHCQNHWNTSKQRGLTSSRFKGVSWDKSGKRWRVIITKKGARIHLGSFKNEFDAARVYNEAAIKYFGEFAKLNDLEGMF